MASQQAGVYVCSLCGNSVEVIRAGNGTLVCCGVPMDHLAENSTDAAQEKHVPVIEKIDGGIRVTVGSVAHPMAEDHWIQWIEVAADGNSYRRQLSAGDRPESVFPISGEQISVRAFCNLHGLWKAG